MMYKFVLIFWLCCFFNVLYANPPVQLATTYDDDILVKQYLVSEKYDGVRAIWKEGKLTSRSGLIISAPSWFTRVLPDIWLDGELWTRRQDFNFVNHLVQNSDEHASGWNDVIYQVFDAPDYVNPFWQRAENYTKLIDALNVAHIKAVKQLSVSSRSELLQMLNEYVASGAEGLMLHYREAMFVDGRSDNLVKLKPYMDAEARVIGYTDGAGKYKGMVGALIVETSTGHIFKIGSGLSDSDRHAPPALGDIITYKYHGLTHKGVPKFASFLRVRYSASECAPEAEYPVSVCLGTE